MPPESINIRDRQLEDEEIVFAPGTDLSHFLGPNVTLNGCRLVLRASARWTTIHRCKFSDCEIIAKRKFGDSIYWPCNSFKGCKFKGAFSGNDFGHRDEEDFWPEGGIADCDFSEATLDACRFWNTDMSTIKLPGWPSFAIFDPAKYADQVQAIDWPNHGLAAWAEVLVMHFDGQVSAMCDHIPSLLKRVKSDLSESDFKALLDQIDGVVY